jgi:Protein of unknown function (DUF2637)
MGYREERRADLAVEREQDRKDRALLLEKQLEAQQLAAAEKRKDKDADAERRRQVQAERLRQRKAAKAARRAARVRAVRWVRDNGDVAAVLAVMACGMVPALVAQYSALRDMGMSLLLAGLLPGLLELGAWAATAGEAKALREKRNVTPYRITVWSFTALAATVNAIHGYRDYGPAGAIVLAASSVAPVALWHMVMAGRHSAKAKRTKEQLAAEKRARAEETKRAEHLKRRRKHHPEVAEAADRLLSAAEFGTLSEEDAFATAWKILHGTDPGLSPELYQAATASRLRVGEAFAEADEKGAELIRASILAGVFNPLSNRPGQRLPKIGKALPMRALAGTREPRTTQAGIGLYTSEPLSETAPKGDLRDGSGDTSNVSRKGRSETELEQLLPRAHEIAAELVAEGRQISAAALAKHLKIRREDGMWLRDRVVADRRLRLVGTEASS